MTYGRDPANVLRAIGMPPKYKGYAYVQYILMLTQQRQEYMYHLTTQLYPRVAQHFDVTQVSVERNIRFAIRRTWDSGNKTELRRLFCVYDVRWIPTNSEFISVLTEVIINDRMKDGVQIAMHF
ncbi:MAG TPA: sporulation initiation factor Spo0A C-terminal domain-containing protein [Clostridia bacterium]|nr:sporulation initiation factor Spo0A C-terminal domain-containing protein [Clostridia bacterium]